MEVLAFLLALIKHRECYKGNAAQQIAYFTKLVPFSSCKLMQTHISRD